MWYHVHDVNDALTTHLPSAADSAACGSGADWRRMGEVIVRKKKGVKE